MGEKAPQNFANHVRLDPPFHFFVLPVTALTVVAAIVHLVERPSWFAGWLVIFAAGISVLAVRARQYALRAQDRIIRLEERLRLGGLLADPLRLRVGELSEAQLIGLRFASDGEIPALVGETLDKQLSNKDIKKAVRNWRPDYWRV
jgi:Family of unknown function (DUF6526)